MVFGVSFPINSQLLTFTSQCEASRRLLPSLPLYKRLFTMKAGSMCQILDMLKFEFIQLFKMLNIIEIRLNSKIGMILLADFVLRVIHAFRLFGENLRKKIASNLDLKSLLCFVFVEKKSHHVP